MKRTPRQVVPVPELARLVGADRIRELNRVATITPLTCRYGAPVTFTLGYWRDVAERAIRTGAQALVALAGLDGLGLRDVGLVALLEIFGFAAAASVVTSLAALPFGVPGTASMLGEIDEEPGRHAA